MDAVKTITQFPGGTVTPPSSKSLGHRAILCAALASGNGQSRIKNISLSDDITATMNAVTALLGCAWRNEGGTFFTEKQKDPASRPVDCGESGSTLRFLIPLAAALGQRATFIGRGRLMERPLGVYADLGVQMDHTDGCVVVSGPLRGGTYRLPGNVSSQFVSGFLFALPLLEENSEIQLTTPLESAAYVDMTINVMQQFGVTIEGGGAHGFRIKGGQAYHPADYSVEADYSQAAFFLCAAALGCDVRCKGLKLNSAQGDRAIIEILDRMGAKVTNESGFTSVKSNALTAIELDVRDVPDLVPPVSALMCFCDGTSRIINAARLRIKESDRLHALASELGKLGALIEEGSDCLTITGQPHLRGGQADSWNDHRIAMALALAGIRCENPVVLSGADSVNKSYPGFWQDFETEERHG